eukprot:gene3118-3899_t
MKVIYQVAIEGCCHGEIEAIYNSIESIEKKTNTKIDLLICCGDYEAIRNQNDLESMAVSNKYKTMGTFHDYYSGRKVAPLLTLVIGGNHESSIYFNELPLGGWLCPNIYYMGRSSVVNVGGLRIAALSGIFKDYDYHKGYFESSIPFMSDDHKRSVYHIDIKGKGIDIFFSHDWPNGIAEYGDKNSLYRFKKHLKSDIESGELGNPHTMQLMKSLKPKFWFSAHLHVKYSAVFPHNNQDNNYNCDNNNNNNEDDKKVTRFLALDKVIPNRDFIQVLNFPSNIDQQQQLQQQEENNESTKKLSSLKLCYDPEWISILNKTSSIFNSYTHKSKSPLPMNQIEKYLFYFTNSDIIKTFY